jgi:hypothetical protein
MTHTENETDLIFDLPISGQLHRRLLSGAVNDQPTFGERDAILPIDAREQITIGATGSWFSHSDLDSYTVAEGSNAEDYMLYWSVLDRRDFVDRFCG